MAYKARLPTTNSNVSQEHPLREFVVLLLGATIVLLLLFFLSGLLVDRAVQYIQPELEKKLFSKFVDDDGQARSDRELELQSLLDELAPCVDVGYAVQVRVEESGELNAFAMPGGQMVMLSAMLDEVQTENGLAFVLAHELGHFKNRDHLRGMGRSLLVLALSSLATGANSGLTSVLTPALSLETASYSQDRESLADATALKALHCHYGHVQGATEFFELIAREEKSREWGLTHYFSSHPEARQRVTALRKLADDLGYEGL